MPSQKLLTFVIDDDLRAALKTLKARDGVSEGETIRRALRRWLQRKGVLHRKPLIPPRSR
jgi:hypothetical protein